MIDVPVVVIGRGCKDLYPSTWQQSEISLLEKMIIVFICALDLPEYDTRRCCFCLRALQAGKAWAQLLLKDQQGRCFVTDRLDLLLGDYHVFHHLNMTNGLFLCQQRVCLKCLKKHQLYCPVVVFFILDNWLLVLRRGQLSRFCELLSHLILLCFFSATLSLPFPIVIF